MNPLQRLRSDDFLDEMFAFSSAEGLRTFLRTRPEVSDLRRALVSGELVERDVEIFVRELLGALSPGKKFTEEIALAAIAVAIESLPGGFVDYLEDLGRVRIQEMPLAPRVAALAVAERDKLVGGLTARMEVISALLPDGRGPQLFQPIPIEAGSSDENLRIAS